jgi:hypothetical protein
MGHDDPLYFSGRRCSYGVDVRIYYRTRIEDDDIFVAQKIGIGSWPRHLAGVRGQQPADAGPNLGRDARSKLRLHRPQSIG